MRNLIVLGFVGLLAQLIDGSLGMAYGVTSSTLLLAAGIAPAAASAAVHFSELGTTLVSGFAHHKLGNVDWRTVSIIALPGGIGAFFGATFLSSIPGDVATPWVAALLLGLGVTWSGASWCWAESAHSSAGSSPQPSWRRSAWSRA